MFLIREKFDSSQAFLLAEDIDIFVIVYLDDILVYTEDPRLPHIDAVRWILEQLRKHGLYANFKKCRFH